MLWQQYCFIHADKAIFELIEADSERDGQSSGCCSSNDGETAVAAEVWQPHNSDAEEPT